tara:strand:- start:20 stop:199 length:180 start_codon:yes stop_codon:yes gene_type:complete
MKPAYKEKALNHIEGIESRLATVQEMLEGKRPPNQADAIKLGKEIQYLLDLTKNIVELS